MKRRGRAVLDQTAAVVIEGNFGGRAEPPDDLNARQREIWREIVASEPAELINTGALRNMLSDLVRHREAAEKISGVVDSFKAEWLKTDLGSKRYGDLLRMRDREITSATFIATKLRLTNQSRYTPQAAATASRNTLKGIKPWEA